MIVVKRSGQMRENPNKVAKLRSDMNSAIHAGHNAIFWKLWDELKVEESEELRRQRASSEARKK